MTNVSAVTIAAQDGPWAQVRTGTVATANANSAVVVVGGTSFSASFISPYSPQPGHLVSVIRQDATWIILGRIAGTGENAIANGSFEDDLDGDAPSGWTQYDIVGASDVAVVTSPLAVTGTKVLSVLPPTLAVAESYVYSSPVPVGVGSSWTLSAYAGATVGDNDPVPVDAALFALWFANSTDLYPTTSSPDTSVAAVTDVPVAPPMTPLSGTVTAPVSGFMRLALRSTVQDTTGLVWDFAVVRESS